MGALLSIADVAVMARWSERKYDKGYFAMKRYLFTVNAQLGGMLLVNRGTKGKNVRWVVAEPALKRLHPDWFDREEFARALGATNQRVDALFEKVDELSEITDLHSREIGRIARKAG